MPSSFSVWLGAGLTVAVAGLTVMGVSRFWIGLVMMVFGFGVPFIVWLIDVRARALTYPVIFPDGRRDRLTVREWERIESGYPRLAELLREGNPGIEEWYLTPD